MSAQQPVQTELLMRYHQLQSRLATLKIENEEVSECMEFSRALYSIGNTCASVQGAVSGRPTGLEAGESAADICPLETWRSQQLLSPRAEKSQVCSARPRLKAGGSLRVVCASGETTHRCPKVIVKTRALPNGQCFAFFPVFTSSRVQS